MSEIKNSYETVIVVSAKLGEDGNEAIIEKFKSLIEKNGVVESVDSWGKRRLAYLINKESEAFYTLINFTSGAEFTAELDRRYMITDGILRTLIIKKDPKVLAGKKEAKAAKTVEATSEKAVNETVTEG